MTPIFASERLDWASAIGLFIINFGVLDWHVFVFLESRMQPDEFAGVKKEYFQDRVARVKALVEGGHYSGEQRQAFARFFARVEPVRQLRNHIAHGHLLVRARKDGKTPILTLSLPKNLDANYELETRHLEFEELAGALSELGELIQEFQRFLGDGSRGRPD